MTPIKAWRWAMQAMERGYSLPFVIDTIRCNMTDVQARKAEHRICKSLNLI